MGVHPFGGPCESAYRPRTGDRLALHSSMKLPGKVVGVATLLLLFTLLRAQDLSFRSGSRVVLVPVTVTDRDGNPVDGLEVTDFEILDQGEPRPANLDTFGTGVAPVSLVTAVQSSGISATALAKIRRVGSMIQPLITGEHGSAALVAFDEKVRWVDDFTSDANRMEQAFAALRTRGNRTAHMLDAAADAVHRLGARKGNRRVLLLLSESRDRGSETKLNDVVMAAQKAAVSIYSISYSAYLSPFTSKPEEVPQSSGFDPIGGFSDLMRLKKQKTVAALTSATGGAEFSFARQQGLEGAITKLGEELHSQYVLSFTPPPETRGYRHLEVRMAKATNHVIRARSAYWASE